MATRSSISVKLAPGKFVGVYCHSDGYPSHVGAILLGHYNSRELAESLVSLGHLSRLRSELAPADGQQHTFDEPVEGVTVAYHRDRGDEFDQSKGRTWKAVTDTIDSKYNYLFKDGLWIVSGPKLNKLPLTRFVHDGVVLDTYT